MAWHDEPPDRVFDQLGTDENGLSSAEAADRLQKYGPNEIQREDGISPIAIFISQFNDVLIYLLFLAAALSIAVGLLPGQEPEYAEAALIIGILLANGLFGFIQDYRAEQAIDALRDLASPSATVVRDGVRRTVPAEGVVPGDLIVIEGGDAISADARLVETSSLETDESMLTGESTSVSKSVDAVPEAAPLAERHCMVYMNTAAVKGNGRAVVVATGMDTEVGSIATQIATAEDRETPFQREVDRLGRRIGTGVLGLIALIAIVQLLFTAAGPITIALVAITLAVAAVPEGLPAVVTLTLALGSRRLLEKNALIRRLPVVESLGSVDVIVTDKTGTLTENSMTVTRLFWSGATYDVSGSGTDTTGSFTREGEEVDPSELDPLLRCGTICNNAEPTLERAGEQYDGDPTEIALLVSAAKAGIEPDVERLRELPFSSDRKRMTVIVEEDGPTAYTKGAPGVLLERCSRIVEDGEIVDLEAAHREAVLEQTKTFANDALRVLGFAFKPAVEPEAHEDDIERDLVFLGLQGMIDPPREEVPGAVGDCRNAGVRVIMATGDNIHTARAIGRQIGFETEGALSGADLDELSPAEIQEVVKQTEVFARVSPAHKVALLEALQASDHTVAMTGDGVNDAPALGNADVGVSMGQGGTDVARQASDMVLLDDNFATIRDAIAEGRGIFDNVRKFVNYLLSANAGEVLVVFVGVLIGTALFPTLFAGDANALILTPVMLLWINLVTDGLPALALGADPTAADVMQRPPRGPDESVITKRMIASILGIGLIMTVTGLGLFFFSLSSTADLIVAQTLLFTLLVAAEVVRIQVIRARYGHSIRSNPWLIGAILSSLLLQLAVLYTPASRFFEVQPPSATGWASIAVAFFAFLALNLLMVRVFDRLLPGH